MVTGAPDEVEVAETRLHSAYADKPVLHIDGNFPTRLSGNAVPPARAAS